MKSSARDRKFTQGRRTAVRFFSIAAWDKEQDYLRRQHAEGWKLERVGFLGVYRFARCTPEDVVYQLDYNPDGLAHKDEYVRMFEDCGWEYLQDYVGYSYFRKPVSQMDGRDEQIFCDDASRAALIRRVFAGRMVPGLLVILLLVVPYVVESVASPTPSSWVLLVLFGLLVLAYGAVLVQFLVRYLRLRHGVAS